MRLWPQEAVNSSQNERCLLELGEVGGDSPPLGPPSANPSQPLFTRSHPLATPKMTPDPSLCLYQAAKVRNSDESLWLRVYTPESRKEGNQPRSAKSGEVRENSCSAPGLQ